MSLVGNLEDLGLGEILQIVSLSRKSGVLSLHSRNREGTVVFRFGQVISASSSSSRENLGELLIKKGVLDMSRLREALTVQQEEGFTERLGSILTRLYGINPEAIEDVVRQQIEDAVYSLFTWVEGTFDFELRDDVEAVDNAKMDPLQFMLQQGLNPQFLAMEGSRIVDEKRHRGELDEEAPQTAGDAAHTDENLDMAFGLISSPAEEPETAEAIPAVAERKKRLVLVDDDPATRSALSSLLEDGGYDVHPFARSEETLVEIDTLYRAGDRPTVIVDLIMPKMDGSGVLGGLELLEIMRNNFQDLPVLALADYRSADAERKVREMGFAYLVKPRKGEVSDSLLMSSFSDKLLPALARAESGEKLQEWSDKVNIGDELRLEMGDALASDLPKGRESTGISLLRGMLEELNNPSLGGGIILLVLRFASEFMNRAVIFIVKRDEVVGLGQFGVDDSDGHANQKVRGLRIPRNEPSLFSRVIDTGAAAKTAPENSGWDLHMIDELGGGTPSEVFMGPIVSEGKVVAVLYGDNIPENNPIGDTEALEIFLSQAGLAMEKALLQRKLKDKSQEET